jgi:hypothetical protein
VLTDPAVLPAARAEFDGAGGAGSWTGPVRGLSPRAQRAGEALTLE